MDVLQDAHNEMQENKWTRKIFMDLFRIFAEYTINWFALL